MSVLFGLVFLTVVVAVSIALVRRRQRRKRTIAAIAQRAAEIKARNASKDDHGGLST